MGVCSFIERHTSAETKCTRQQGEKLKFHMSIMSQRVRGTDHKIIRSGVIKDARTMVRASGQMGHDNYGRRCAWPMWNNGIWVLDGHTPYPPLPTTDKCPGTLAVDKCTVKYVCCSKEKPLQCVCVRWCCHIFVRTQPTLASVPKVSDSWSATLYSIGSGRWLVWANGTTFWATL